MAYILKAKAQFEPDELIALLKERPDLLHPRLRFLQGPFPIQNLGRLELLGLDDQGGWVLVKIAKEGNGELLLSALHQMHWVQNHSEWIATLPAYALADAASIPTIFFVCTNFGNALNEVLMYLRDVTVGLVKYTGFDMGEKKGVHFEPLYQMEGAREENTGEVSGNAPMAATQEPNLSLLQPLSDEEIAQFLPGTSKENMA